MTSNDDKTEKTRFSLSEERVERLYEDFLHTGDLADFYKCLEIACSNNSVRGTAIELIKSKYKDDEDGRAAINSSNYNQSIFNEQLLQYNIWRSRGLSEGKIWKILAEIYGSEADTIKRQFKRKSGESEAG